MNFDEVETEWNSSLKNNQKLSISKNPFSPHETRFNSIINVLQCHENEWAERMKSRIAFDML